MDITTWLWIVLVVLALYWHFTKTFRYWKHKGVYYLKPTIVFGNIKNRMLFRQSFHEFQRDLYNKFQGHGFAGFYEGRRPTLMVRDPELIRHIMVKDFEYFTDRPMLHLRQKKYIDRMLINLKGQEWKRVRSTLTPAFSTGKLHAMEYLVVQCGMQLRDFLHLQTSNKSASTPIETKDLFGRFTMDVIASCAFGVQCDSLLKPDSEFINVASKFNEVPLLQRILLFAVIFLIPGVTRFTPLSVFNNKTVDFLVDVLKDAKRARESTQATHRNDFIQLLLDAASQDSTVMDDETVIAQSLLFLLAGYETTSTLLSFASYEFAVNPDVQAAARKEVQDVLKRHKDECSYEALQNMVYLENVLFETLRKHPPVARVDRTCTAPYKIPGTDVTVDAGYSVSIPVMGLHYDPQYYPDPDTFNPDRFLPENKAARSPYVYLPFGAGPRNCIGTRFAVMSAKIAMASVLPHFSLTTSATTSIPAKYNKYSMLLKAEGGIWLNIQQLS